MALHNTWGDFNKRTEYERSVSYSAEPIRYSSTELEPRTLCWKAKRRSVTRFEYIGMSKTAADACKSDMIAKYTRSYMRWEARLIENQGDYPDVAIDQSHVVDCGAGIEEKNVAGDNYSVELAVDETDEIIVREEPKTKDDFESIFQEAELRDGQDYGLDGIAIVYAQWSRVDEEIKAGFLHKIANFDSSLLGVQIKNGTSWESATGVTVDGAVVTFHAGTNKTFRLNYNDGLYLSKAYTTDTPPNYRTVLDDVKLMAVPTSVYGSSRDVHLVSGSSLATISGIMKAELAASIGINPGLWRADIAIGSDQFDVGMSAFSDRGYEQNTGFSLYYFETRPFELPISIQQPITNARISIYPSGQSRVVMSNPFTATQTDYINIVSKNRTGNVITVVFSTNLSMANLASTVRGMIIYRNSLHYRDIPVTYQSTGSGQFSAVFDASGTLDMFCIHGVNAEGVDFISRWMDA